MKFGETFKKLRIENSLSKQELAKRLNVCPTCISFWEYDKRRPQFETLLQLADIYDITLDELLGRKDY